MYLLILTTLVLTACASTNNDLTEKTVDQKKAELYYGEGTRDLVNKNYSAALTNL